MKDDIKLSRRRILIGLGTVGIASAGAGAGTMALFEDQEDAQAKVQAGTLDLQVNGADGTVTILDEPSIAPGDSGSETVYIRNAGTVDGLLTAQLTDVTDKEKGLTDAERDEGDDNTTGELSQYLEVALEYGGHTTRYWKLADVPRRTFGPWALLGGDRKVVTVKWRLPTSVGNVVQSDRVTADMRLTLTQDSPYAGTTGSEADGTRFPQTSYDKAFGSELKVHRSNYSLRLKDASDAADDSSKLNGGTFQSGQTYAFELAVDAGGEATLTVGNDSVTHDYGGTYSRVAVIAQTRSGGQSATVENLTIDGMPTVPDSRTTTAGTVWAEFDGLDGSDGLTVTGDVTFEYTDPEESAAVYIDVA